MSKKRKATEVVFEYTGLGEDVPRDVTIVQFHSSVTEVVDNMFKGCEQLKKVVFNEGLLKIGNYAFCRCRSLKSINLPSTTTEIVGNAFMSCNNLEEVALNEGLIKIGTRSFHGCESLQSITLPSTVTKVGDAAFCECRNLETVVLNEGLEKLGAFVFAGCRSLKCIALPRTVTKIGHHTFAFCHNLREVELLEGLQKIEPLVFGGCSFECITIPSSVTEIGSHAFYDCRNLREVRLHEGIEKIGDHAFGDCSSLERFTFPTLSTRLVTITQAGQRGVEDKIDDIRGQAFIERRDTDVFISVVALGVIFHDSIWKIVRGILGRIDRLITYHELREATTLFELALWKSKIDQADANRISSRDEYQIDIPGPVKNNILQYLDFRV